MQTTRRLILQYLKEHGEATVDELAAVLQLTTVTVRHHLDVLRSEELVAEPATRHRSSPGRPQFAYALTPKASAHFPKNYCDLAASVIEQVRASATPGDVNVFFEGIAGRLAASAPAAGVDEPVEQRLTRAVEFLNDRGYVAHWEPSPAGPLLHTCNCPYEGLAGDNPELCGMDLALVSRLVGVDVQRQCRIAEGAPCCSYLVPGPDNKTEQILSN